MEFKQLITRGFGIDVHKKTLVSPIRGIGIEQETREFDCFTECIEELRDWLNDNKITHGHEENR